MYRHFRMAMRQAQDRHHLNQARSNERRRRSDREMSRTAPVVCPAPCFTTDGVDETAIPEEAMSSADPR